MKQVAWKDPDIDGITQTYIFKGAVKISENRMH
jgi:hypothetical protein